MKTKKPGRKIKAAIVDYGMGNLYSVKLACEHAGMQAEVTTSSKTILSSDAVILPGVGAFGDAMATLKKLKLTEVLKKAARTGKPFLGICLGMQLMMTESSEFGKHKGLGIIKGKTVGFKTISKGKKLKVPHIGWNTVYGPSWKNSLFSGIAQKSHMYFVHSFYTKPSDSRVVCGLSKYGDLEFCSALRKDNLFAVQFHPERSGKTGLRLYENFKKFAENSLISKKDAA